MLVTRSLGSKIVIQLVVTLMALPFLLPLVAMVQGSLGGRGLGNYVKVWETGVLPTYLLNSVLISVFAILILVAHVTGQNNAMTLLGAQLFFWGRVAHAIVYLIGIPWLRTAVWAVSFAGILLVLFQLI